MRILTLMLLLALSISNYSQNEELLCGGAESVPGQMPLNIESILGVTGIPVGGREITNQGILRVLVIFVRFKDDYTNTPSWPDYNVLPSWAESIIDNEIPLNNLYTPGNISDFMDRASGGDGAGNLGIFKVIGDVYYVTTDEDESYYAGNYTLINSHVLTKLNNQIDYTLYDNWKFMKNGEYYDHEYFPGTGDGNIDFVMFFNRADLGTVGGYKGYFIPSNFSLDGKLFNRYGSTQFGYRNQGTNKVTITIPVHEFSHYLFGGGNIKGHLDGRIVYGGQLNIGNVAFFALMLSVAGTNSFYSAYERYRAGWLNPTVLNNSQSSLFLQDTHKKHKAYLIPVRQDDIDPSIIAEYYIIENFQTTNSYSSANPFLTRSVFNHTFDHGILVFHIEQEDYNFATNSNLDIECADGLWDFHLTAGANTPYDREDDIFAKNTTSRINGFDERDAITITVVPITYDDYFCLTPSSCGTSCPPNHGRRYYKDATLGDRDDFYRYDETRVFSSWSNPQLGLASGTNIYKGFEIKNYYSNIREYEISFQSDYNDVLSLSPSKPQNLSVEPSANNHPYATWDANQEPDVISGGYYNVWKKKFYDLEWYWNFLAQTTNNYYEDSDETYCPGGQHCAGETNIYYRVTAVDNQLKESVPSDSVVTRVTGFFPYKTNLKNPKSLNTTEYSLAQNYPNPFNPTTTISYSIKKNGLTSLKVYDILGNVVVTLVNENETAGNYSVEFNAEQLPSGIYIYRLISGHFTASKKLILMK